MHEHEGRLARAVDAEGDRDAVDGGGGSGHSSTMVFEAHLRRRDPSGRMGRIMAAHRGVA